MTQTGMKNICNVDGGFTSHDPRPIFATNARKAGVEKNVIMVIMGHSTGNDMNFRYNSVDEADWLNSVDQIEVFLKSVDHPVDQGQKKSSQNESSNAVSICFNCGAEGESRTRTSIRTLDPEPSASTNSATSAR